MKESLIKFTNRRGQRLAPIACMVMVSALLGACATKGDIRNLRMEISALRAKQDSLYGEMTRQAQAQSAETQEGLRTTRGQISNQIRQLQEAVITLQELSGQSQQRINELRAQLERAQVGTPGMAAPAPQQPGGGNAEELYQAGATKFEEKSATAARLAFEQFLTDFPEHELAADAQFKLAETYVLDENYAEAVKHFERVPEAYPTSPRAPEALYRAGQVSEQRNRRSEARQFYNRVVQRYADSPSASLAQKRLTALR
jgi:tol-pal system protein YbgF